MNSILLAVCLMSGGKKKKKTVYVYGENCMLIKMFVAVHHGVDPCTLCVMSLCFMPVFHVYRMGLYS